MLCSKTRRRVVLTLILACVTAPRASQAQENRFCLVCHANAAQFAGRPDSAAMVVTAEEHAASVHGSLGFACVGCHEHVGYPHPDDVPPVKCERCHAEIGETYAQSLHGYAVARGNPRAPGCTDCHGTHDVLRVSDPNSPVHGANVTETCAKCHGTGGLLTEQRVKLAQTAASYARSVHGRAAERGVEQAAHCDDCHEVHDLRSPADPLSKINRLNVSSTCGACHTGIRDEYDRSIHGRALQAGVMDSPTCNDCHGEHLILSPRDPSAATYAAHLAVDVCGACHDDPDIISKYSLQGEVLRSYVDSYHGWSTRREHGHSATCVSCHAAHLVLPKDDPESTVHESNVVATCQTCHPRADLRFARSYDHLAVSITRNPINRAIRTIYIVAIVVIIGGMAAHNVVVMNYYVIEKRRAELAGRTVLRLDRTEVAQHLLLAVTFIVLVITGFALRYPDATWARLAESAGLTEPVRSLVHRIAGVLLILTALWHAYYVLAVHRGRQKLRALLPRWRDFRDLSDNLRFHTWLSRRKPRFGRYDYTMKAEYWALVWGTLLMAFTGLVLWFPPEAVRIFPAWIVAASQTVHFYEAWLAMLAILVWHFFFVILHPDVYPMSWAWLTGRLPEEDVREHHPDWWEEELAPETEEARQPAAASRRKARVGPRA